MSVTLMFQGTSSNVGKSVLAAAFCRIFRQDGHRVAPFKSQNMALNSFITRDGGEMGRAQVVQAEAAGVEPDVRMNPILLKPTGQSSSQVVVLGKAIGNLSAQEYHLKFNLEALDVIRQSLDWLKERYDIIVIEGAGSPAEVNLKARDIANMRIAKLADAPVLLVADIDRGGALAAVVGTLELLEPDERERVKGILINKFRGDLKLLQPALDFLEERTGKPVLGVIPYYNDVYIPAEDSVALEQKEQSVQREGQLQVAVVQLPRISNFTDLDALAGEPGVHVAYARQPEDLAGAHLVILPGSKNTIEDLLWLRQSGLAGAILDLAEQGTPVFGICGGYQMLGRKVSDPLGVEASLAEVEGLGLLDMTTEFFPEKETHQARGRVTAGPFAGLEVEGYEIHMGRTTLGEGCLSFLQLTERRGEGIRLTDGAWREDGKAMGTYLHGIFDEPLFRRTYLNWVRERAGLPPVEVGEGVNHRRERDAQYDRLADVVRGSVDLAAIYRLMGMEGQP